MLQFDPQKLSERENYKLLIGSVIPRPVAVVTTLSENEQLNIAPFSYFSIVSTQPTIVSIAVQRRENQMKDTARNILAGKAAVIHILDSDNVKDANQTAASLLPEESELSVSNFTTSVSSKVAVPSLNEAKVRFETILYQHIPIHHLEKVTADLFLLEIKHYAIDEAIYQEGRIDAGKLAAISRLAGSSYATIGDIFEMERPT
ncbi:MAG TPA: flavin reductase family protein [Enterococcus sp.]|nr:flavin reductase family protein [Enterococcus sp.]